MGSILHRRHRFLGGIKHFLDSRESVEDESRSGRPCTSKTEENLTKVRALMRSDRRLTVRMIGSELNLNYRTVHDILTEELGPQRICAKLVQKKKKTSPTNKRKTERMCAWPFLKASNASSYSAASILA